jgi:hypothetical protein
MIAPPARAAAALIFASASAWPGVSGAQEAQRGFNFCAPPLRPACIDAPTVKEACETEVQAFIKFVFKYRGCLEKETERVVREANDSLEAWKCRTGALKCR